MAISTPISGLTVRQHEREGIQVPVQFIVKPAHAAQVKFSASSGAMNANTVQAEAIDISSGGMGLQSRVLIPRMCEGTLRVFLPGASDAEPELMFEHDVKIRRVIFSGREPMYSLGVAFLNPGRELDQQIAALFERMGASNPSMKMAPAGAGGSNA